MIYLSAEQILFILERVIEETGGSHGIRDLNMLLYALGRLQASFDDEDLIPGLFHKAAALLEALVLNHPFVDGNKRTAIVAAALTLQLNGYHLTATNAEVVDIGLRVAQARCSLEEITTWLESNSEEKY